MYPGFFPQDIFFQPDSYFDAPGAWGGPWEPGSGEEPQGPDGSWRTACQKVKRPFLASSRTWAGWGTCTWPEEEKERRTFQERRTPSESAYWGNCTVGSCRDDLDVGF